MKRGLLYGGGSLIALILLRWGWKRRVAKNTLGLPGWTSTRVATAAAAQVVKAAAGSRLTDYRSAEDRTIFDNIPASNGEAYHHAAYWQAVASRLLGKRSLAALASTDLGKGNLLMGVPFSSQLTGSVREILHEAARRVRSEAGGDRQALAVAKLLSPSAGAISTTQKARDEASAGGIAKGTIVKSWEDAGDIAGKVGSVIGSGANLLRGMLGINNPDGSPPSFLMRWGPRIGLGAAVLLFLRIRYAGHYHTVRAAFAKPPETKALASPAGVKE